MYLCRRLLDVCYTDAYKHFATLKHQAHASSCKSMNVSFEEVNLQFSAAKLNQWKVSTLPARSKHAVSEK